MKSDLRIQVVEDPHSVEQLCADLRRKSVVGVDVETEDILDDYHVKGRAKLFSVQYATDDQTYFVPTYGSFKVNVEPQRAFIEDPNPNKVLHNGKFDALAIACEGPKMRGLLCDTFVAEYTHYTDSVYPNGTRVFRGLKELSKKYFGYTDLKDYGEEFKNGVGKRRPKRTRTTERKVVQKDDGGWGYEDVESIKSTGYYLEALVDVNREIGCQRMGATNARIVEYACKDPWLTVKLYHHVKQRLSDQPWLSKTMRGKSMWDYYYDIERRFTEVLIKMEWAGAKLDTERLPLLDKAYEEEQIRLLGEWAATLHQYRAPAGFSHRSNDDVSALLTKYCGLQLWKTTATGKFSVDKKVLEELVHPVANLVLEMRAVDRGRNTYVKELLECSSLFNGYVHSTYNQCGTRTWRLSSDSPNCFDPETEVLTQAGWVKIPELVRGTPVAAWAPNGVLEWQKPTAYYEREYTGDMIHVTGRVDVRVTPEHRMICNASGSKFFDRRADQLAKQGLPTAGVLVGGHDEDRDILRFVCAAQADGNMRRHSPTSKLELRFGFKKQRKIDRMREILTATKTTHSASVTADGVTTFSMACPPVLLRYLTEEHVFKEEALLGLSLSSRQTFLSELVHWDGNLHSKGGLVQYWSSKNENVSAVLTIASVSGVKASRGDYVQSADGITPRYAISLMQGPAVYNLNKDVITRESYTGKVYCLSVPSTYVLTRRNGRVCVTGQCQNIPSTDKGKKGSLGRKVREMFVAPPGEYIGCIDGSQIEVRMAALFSKDKMLVKGLFEQLDMHSLTTIEVFPEVKAWARDKQVTPELLAEIATLFKDQRSYAKNVRFASQYKAGGKKVASMCRVPDEEGIRMVQAFWNMHSGLRDYGEVMTKYALDRGYVLTILGRRGYIGMAKSADEKRARTAAYMQGTSTQFQGSVADLTKLWMIFIDENCPGITLQSQVHDELVMRGTLEAFREYGHKIESYVSEPLMHYAGVKLWMPTPADLGVAPNWAGAKAKGADIWKATA
jgi:DNA polymerase I-like protein with 3'-5' exonuclease and polymerase domains